MDSREAQENGLTITGPSGKPRLTQRVPFPWLQGELESVREVLKTHQLPTEMFSLTEHLRKEAMRLQPRLHGPCQPLGTDFPIAASSRGSSPALSQASIEQLATDGETPSTLPGGGFLLSSVFHHGNVFYVGIRKKERRQTCTQGVCQLWKVRFSRSATVRVTPPSNALGQF